MDDYIIKRFENPDEVREFDKGKYEVINLPGMTIGKATYYKGWKWSVDVSPLSGTEFCETEHLGTVSYTHLRAHETGRNLVCRLLLEKKK